MSRRGRAMMPRIKDITAREPQLIHVDLPLSEAADRMKAVDSGALLVVDGDELVGMVTDRDLVGESARAGRPDRRTGARLGGRDPPRLCATTADSAKAAICSAMTAR